MPYRRCLCYAKALKISKSMSATRNTFKGTKACTQGIISTWPMTLSATSSLQLLNHDKRYDLIVTKMTL